MDFPSCIRWFIEVLKVLICLFTLWLLWFITSDRWSHPPSRDPSIPRKGSFFRSWNLVEIRRSWSCRAMLPWIQINANKQKSFFSFQKEHSTWKSKMSKQRILPISRVTDWSRNRQWLCAVVPQGGTHSTSNSFQQFSVSHRHESCNTKGVFRLPRLWRAHECHGWGLRGGIFGVLMCLGEFSWNNSMDLLWFVTEFINTFV